MLSMGRTPLTLMRCSIIAPFLYCDILQHHVGMARPASYHLTWYKPAWSCLSHGVAGLVSCLRYPGTWCFQLSFPGDFSSFLCVTAARSLLQCSADALNTSSLLFSSAFFIACFRFAGNQSLDLRNHWPGLRSNTCYQYVEVTAKHSFFAFYFFVLSSMQSCWAFLPV